MRCKMELLQISMVRGHMAVLDGVQAVGCRLLAAGSGCWFLLLTAGCWLLGAGCWVLGAGCWVLGAGCCSEDTNGHGSARISC